MISSVEAKCIIVQDITVEGRKLYSYTFLNGNDI